MAQFKGAPSLFGNTNMVSQPVSQPTVKKEEKKKEQENKAENKTVTKAEVKTPVKTTPAKSEETQKESPKAEPVKEIKTEEKKNEAVEAEKAIKKAEETPNVTIKTETAPAEQSPTKYVSRMQMETDKSRVGRPRQEGEFKMVSVRLTLENYETAMIDGAKYGGMTGFLNYLIRTYKENN